ncbi:MAG: efflux RND transporter periplasmic adaptor subunit [Candidatus Aminicenantes bacterium]|nr:efflux RND transporter periplasmic adaptor subunit [Candidatus Aminicenantes bacterium]
MTKTPFIASLRKSSPAVKAGLVVVLALAGWGLYKLLFASGGGGPAGGPRGPVVAVETTPVRRGPIRDIGLFSGTLIPKTSFSVAPKISGKLKRLFVDIGDTVRQGQLIALLEDEEYQQQVLQAEADLRVARANLVEAKSSLELAKRDLERARTLHAKGIQSDAQLDSAIAQAGAQESRYKVAEAQEANRQAALETARVRLSYTQIRAAWERGSETRYVGERFVNEGAMLSVNTQIISIIELQPITAVLFVTDRDYQRLGTGQETTITSGAFTGKTFLGKVVRIAPLLQETSRQARVEVEITNPEGLLKPGMFITAQVEFGARAEATIVPINAVVQRNNLAGVFLADTENMKAGFVPVRIGIVQGEQAEVLEPASLDGEVVTLGHHLLEDGAGIILPQRGDKPAGQPGAPAKKKAEKPASKPASKPAGKRS